MFWNNRSNAVEQENTDLRTRIRELEDQLAQANSDLKTTQSQLGEAQSDARSNTKNDFTRLWANSSTLLDSVRATLANSTSKLTEHRDNFAGSSQLFSQIMDMLSATAEATTQISSDTEQANAAATELKNVVLGINNFVDIIRGISDQTNLLALNAAIEAARAGEQGRGFAVVADEVRTLAQRSSEASNEISTLIENVNSQMQGVIDSMHGIGEKGEHIANSTQSIQGTAERIVGISHNMLEVITCCAGSSFIHTVKMDHIAWKTDVYKVILGMSDKTADSFSNHKGCRLGQWYYTGEGCENYSGYRPFSRLEQPHIEVHQHGVAAMQAKANGDDQLAAEKLGQMERASVEVIKLLSELSSQYLSEHGENSGEADAELF